MGYTHYWSSTESFTKENWDKFVEEVKNTFETTNIPLGNGIGNENSKPEIDNDFVSFNGIGDDSYETCLISFEKTSFDCCKTALKPYDSVVIEVLKLARKYNNSFDLSSDGGPEVFE